MGKNLLGLRASPIACFQPFVDEGSFICLQIKQKKDPDPDQRMNIRLPEFVFQTKDGN